jgi:uncharacterized SAM-binding protein YcdF (DUF218 family)
MRNRPRLRKFLIITGTLLFILLIVFVARRPIMRSLGNYLIEEDELSKCEALFVLSGNPNDRSLEAARLLKTGYAPYVICTGEVIPRLFEVIGDTTTDEADLSRIALLKAGVNDSNIVVLHIGTSTREESIAILEYCKQKGLKKIMLVSDKFHTNRIDYAFRDLYENAGIELVLRGCPSTAYSEDVWWAEEAGLLMVNNEYIKLIYYHLKH